MSASDTSVNYLKKGNEGMATLLAFALIPLSGFATDIYLPSLPSIALAIGATNLQVQLTLSLFLISYGVSQLFVGSIVDSFGRYKLSLWCLGIFAVSCLIVANTRNIYVIYLMRIIHGVTVASIVVAKRAFFVDVYEGEKRKHYLSLFTIIWSSGPIIAPFIGGYLQTALGWESNFYFLAGLAVILTLLEFKYSGETLRHFSHFNLRNITRVYADMFKTPSFILGIAMLGLAYSMIMVYNMTGPFIIESNLGFTPVVSGYCSLLLGFAWMVGGFIGKATINSPFLKKISVNLFVQLLFIGGMIFCLTIVQNLYSLVFFAFIIHVTAGYIFNNYFTFCLGRFPQNAGIASGLTGGVTYMIVSFLSYLIVTILPAHDASHLSYSYLILSLLSVLVMFLIVKLTRGGGEAY